MGSADRVPANRVAVSKHTCALTGCSDPLDRPIAISRSLASILGRYGGLCDGWAPVGLALHHQRPTNAGGLVGDPHGGHLPSLPPDSVHPPHRSPPRLPAPAPPH